MKQGTDRRDRRDTTGDIQLFIGRRIECASDQSDVNHEKLIHTFQAASQGRPARL